jgi:hypothetical protein
MAGIKIGLLANNCSNYFSAISGHFRLRFDAIFPIVRKVHGACQTLREMDFDHDGN